MVNKSAREKIKFFLYLCIVASPILSLYSRNGISLSIILIIVSYSLYFIFVDHKFYIRNIYGTSLVLLSIFTGVFFTVVQSTNTSTLLRMIQFVVLIFVPLSINPIESDYHVAKKIYIWVAMFASIFLIVQFVFLNIFGVYVPGVINNPLFPPNESILTITSKTISSSRRVSGLFSEPASHSVYVLGAFALALFGNDIKKHKFVLFILGLSILMSVSSTGILGLAFLILIYVIYEIIKKKGRIKISSLLTFFVLVLAFFVISQTSIWTLFIQRIDQGTSLNNRFAAYSQPLDSEIGNVLFGHGMDLESLPSSVYYAGYPRFVYYFGLVGLLLWLMMIISSFKNTKSEIILLLLLFIFLNIGESTMLGFSGSLFLLLVFLGKNNSVSNLSTNSI